MHSDRKSGIGEVQVDPGFDRALRESEERYRALVQATATIEWRADASGSMFEAPLWAAYTGQPAEEHRGSGWIEMVHRDDREAVRELWDAGHRTGNPVEVEYRVFHAASQDYRWVRESGVPLKHADGSVREWVGAVIDIHERRQAEEALKLSEERLRVALAAGRMGTWFSDLRTGELFWDDAQYRVFGVDRAGGQIESGAGWALIYPEDRARLRALLDRAIATGEPYDCEFRIVRPDGELRWCVGATGVTRNADGRPIRISGVTFDVTDRKQAEEQLRLLLNELNHRVKNTLAIVQAIVSQSLRHSPDPWQAFDRAQARLMALSATHDLLNATHWIGASLRGVLQRELAPYFSRNDESVVLTGAPVELDAKMAVALGLIVHELATNAAKYGALSEPGGRLHVSWRVVPGEAEPRLRLLWQEAGGPKVALPLRKGFGSRLIERSVTGDLAGEYELDYAEGGLRCSLSLPLPMPVHRLLPEEEA